MRNLQQKEEYSPETSGTLTLPSREEIEDKYKWNLNDIYESVEGWEADFKWIQDNLERYKSFAGKIAESSENLLACLKFDDEVGIKLERLYLYTMLAKDSDLRVGKFQSMDERVKSLYSRVSTVSSFIRPELLNIPEDKL